MSDQKQNSIGGSWGAGDARANINPSNTADIIGHYARANEAQAHDAIKTAKAERSKEKVVT
jgi:alpha-ketoglutaric semialdehyde dehydrogenase